ncbi:amidohydrolase [Clostridium sp.]|uniref:amidohydrolase n=1 Tax=Clostridium sp. TaxID=1506 RepID=UPI003D6D8F9E
MSVSEKIVSVIENKRDLFIDVSDKIWDYAEIRFKEFKSSELLCSVLEDEGFKVTKGVGGIETAFIASFRQGTPIIAVLGEFDALSNLNQKSKIAKEEAVIKGANGHGCGHNALGSGSLAAVVAVKEYLKDSNIQGTIRYYGCPAEEGGSGKVYMAREKVFDDVDIALTWHPSSMTAVNNFTTLACIQSYFKFHRISSHAALSPHLGRSALDAVELMDIGVNYLREHIIPEARIHYAITNTGGISPNVVQANADVLHLTYIPLNEFQN